jgi:hypothetical protein
VLGCRCRIDALGAWHHEDNYLHNGSGDHHSRWRGLARQRSLVLNLFEGRRDARKGRFEMRTDPSQNRNDRERNTSSDKAVLDGRSRRLVFQESNEIPAHHGL